MPQSLRAPTWGTQRPRGFAAIGFAILNSGLRSRRIKKHILKNLIGNGVGVYDIRIEDMKFRCHVTDNTTERELVLARRERDRIEVAAILERLPVGGTFFDVGANSGLFSLMAARKAGPSGRIVAIEPSPVMVERLRFNVCTNGFNNVEIIEAAAGAETGSATLYVNPKQRGKSNLAEMQEGCIGETVPVRTLLSIVELAGIDRIDAMKIDVEGYEDRVLLPFVTSAPKSVWPKAILMETLWASRWRDGCLVRLIEAGYQKCWESDLDALIVLEDT
jgi:FkbM family methyltransferase